MLLLSGEVARGEAGPSLRLDGLLSESEFLRCSCASAAVRSMPLEALVKMGPEIFLVARMDVADALPLLVLRMRPEALAGGVEARGPFASPMLPREGVDLIEERTVEAEMRCWILAWCEREAVVKGEGGLQVKTSLSLGLHCEYTSVLWLREEAGYAGEEGDVGSGKTLATEVLR